MNATPSAVCLHCEANPSVHPLGLCETCGSNPRFVILYERRKGWTPEWEEHLIQLTRRAQR